MSIPWNDWYHCTAHTFGTWLRGDPKGWRSRHHREHVIGDYKNPPPPGTYDKLYNRSLALMKRDRVVIDQDAIIEFVLVKIVERMQEFQTPVAAACFDGVHLHVLQQCVNHDPKIKLGIAKQYATSQLKAHIEKARGSAPGLNAEVIQAFDALNLKLGEGLWATGSHALPITCERHYANASDYISNHVNQGGIVIAPSNDLTSEQHFPQDFGLLD